MSYLTSETMNQIHHVKFIQGFILDIKMERVTRIHQIKFNATWGTLKKNSLKTQTIPLGYHFGYRFEKIAKNCEVTYNIT